MAIYHVSVSKISKAKGGSAVAHSAYISGEKEYSEADAKFKKYGHEDRVGFNQVFLCENAPQEYENHEVLWNAVEKAEKAGNAEVARKINVALPKELSPDKNIELSKKIGRYFANQGMCIEIAVHNLEREEGKEYNPHAHGEATVRAIREDGSWAPKSKKAYLCRNSEGDEKYMTADQFKASKGEGWEKVYKYHNGNDWKQLTPSEASREENSDYKRASKYPVDMKVNYTNWSDNETLQKWRKDIADMINHELELKEQSLRREYADESIRLDRVDHRSHKERGLEEKGIMPTIHEGYKAREIERQGGISERMQINRETRKSNRLIQSLLDNAKQWAEQAKTISEQLRAAKDMLDERVKEQLERFKKLRSKNKHTETKEVPSLPGSASESVAKRKLRDRYPETTVCGVAIPAGQTVDFKTLRDEAAKGTSIADAVSKSLADIPAGKTEKYYKAMHRARDEEFIRDDYEKHSARGTQLDQEISYSNDEWPSR